MTPFQQRMTYETSFQHSNPFAESVVFESDKGYADNR